MPGLIKKASFFYCSHLMTFSLIGFFPSLQGKFGVFLVMAFILPLWMSSAVLWAEKTENYRFLRMLPITDKEIVTVKLSLILATGFAGMAITSIYIFIAGERGGSISTNLVTAAVGCTISVLVAYVWQICCWKFGVGVMTPFIVVSLFLQFLLVMIPLMKRSGRSLISTNEIPLFQFLAQPLGFIPLLAIMAMMFYGLWHLGLWVFEQSDLD